jgi:DNA primase
MLENPGIIENTLDYLDPSLLQFHAQEFSLVLNGEFEHPLLMKISLSSDIKTFDESDLKNELLHFLRKYYTNELKKVKMQQDIPYDKKTFFIRQFTEKVNKLRRGELVPFGV